MTALRVRVHEGDALTELPSLKAWLSDTAELRGRVTGVELPPPPGTLGPLLDAIDVALGPGGAATAFATAIIAWIRHRSSSVKITISRPDGERVELEASRVRGLDADSLQAQVEGLLNAARPDED